VASSSAFSAGERRLWHHHNFPGLNCCLSSHLVQKYSWLPSWEEQGYHQVYILFQGCFISWWPCQGPVLTSNPWLQEPCFSKFLRSQIIQQAWTKQSNLGEQA
jgi:hypothetical protein